MYVRFSKVVKKESSADANIPENKLIIFIRWKTSNRKMFLLQTLFPEARSICESMLHTLSYCYTKRWM